MADNFQKALSLVYFYLKFRPRTTVEIIRYLEKKSIRFHFDEKTIVAVVDDLKEQGLLDDTKFISLYVKNRLLLKPRSVFLLKRELSHLGIANDLIEEYFAIHRTDETALAQELLRRKINSYSRLDNKTRFKKAISYLLRKGFTYDVAKKAYDELLRF